MTNLRECGPVCPISVKPLSLVDETEFDPVQAIDAETHYDENVLETLSCRFWREVLTGLTHPGTHACKTIFIKKRVFSKSEKATDQNKETQASDLPEKRESQPGCPTRAPRSTEAFDIPPLNGTSQHRQNTDGT